MKFIDAITSRSSTRAYLDKPVARELITQVLDLAKHAPSAVNTQPWQVHVVTDKAKDKISKNILSARAKEIKPNQDYSYYPETWIEPYRSRRKECGKALYQALEIGMTDTEKRLSAWNRNYTFFGAPVGLFVFIDAVLAKGSWMDIGMFIQAVMLSARNFALSTCPQAAMAEYPDIVRTELKINKDQLLVCGIALGYPDYSQAINQYRTTRISVDEFTTWHD